MTDIAATFAQADEAAANIAPLLAALTATRTAAADYAGWATETTGEQADALRRAAREARKADRPLVAAITAIVGEAHGHYIEVLAYAGCPDTREQHTAQAARLLRNRVYAGLGDIG